MFAFHKPKTFRSVNGCCICKAKSSSSRFTDSKRYEGAFARCFKMAERRSGEICNACVLLVKRFLRLPVDTKKHWNHVVDARSGPGIKNLVRTKGGKICKPRSLEDEAENETPDKIKRKHVYRGKHHVRRKIFAAGGVREPVPRHYRKKQPTASIRRIIPGTYQHTITEGFFDKTIWAQEQICCGTIFRGPNGEIAVDSRYMPRYPCGACKTLKEPALGAASSMHHSSRAESLSSNDVRLEDLFDSSSIVATSTDSSSSGGEETQAAQAAAAAHMANAMKLAEDATCDSVDDEGFFDKQAGSPSSVSGASTPPPLPPNMAPSSHQAHFHHPEPAVHHRRRTGVDRINDT